MRKVSQKVEEECVLMEEEGSVPVDEEGRDSVTMSWLHSCGWVGSLTPKAVALYRAPS